MFNNHYFVIDGVVVEDSFDADDASDVDGNEVVDDNVETNDYSYAFDGGDVDVMLIMTIMTITKMMGMKKK